MAQMFHKDKQAAILFDILIEWRARNLFDAQSRQGIAVVAVDKDFPRRMSARRHFPGFTPSPY
jgi:hypothetical protein